MTATHRVTVSGREAIAVDNPAAARRYAEGVTPSA